MKVYSSEKVYPVPLNLETDTNSDDVCSPQQRGELTTRVVEAVNSEVPCFEGGVYFDDNGEVSATAASRYGMMFVCDDEDLEPLNEAAVKATTGVKPNCFPKRVGIRVDGLFHEDIERAAQVAEGACDLWSGRDFVVHLDENGFVSDVTPTSADPAEMETAACVLAALDGLRFPCLANFDICPEYLIAE